MTTKNKLISFVLCIILTVSLLTPCIYANPYYDRVNGLSNGSVLKIRKAPAEVDGNIKYNEYDGYYTGTHSEYFLGECAAELYETAVYMSKTVEWYFSWYGDYLNIAAKFYTGVVSAQKHEGGVQKTDEFIACGPGLNFVAENEDSSNGLYSAVSQNTETGEKIYYVREGSPEDYSIDTSDFVFWNDGDFTCVEARIPLKALYLKETDDPQEKELGCSISLVSGSYKGNGTNEYQDYSLGVRLGNFGFCEDSDKKDKSHQKFVLTETQINLGTIQDDELTWTYEDGVLTASGEGPMQDFPDLKEFRDSVKTIVVEEGVTSIGAGAFAYFKNLEKISLPDSLTIINHDAFRECVKLYDVNIPEGVTSLGEFAFVGCEALQRIIIPSGVRSIGYYTFGHCFSLESIYFTGDSPDFTYKAFASSPAVGKGWINAYFPKNNETWTKNVLIDYDGKINWFPSEMTVINRYKLFRDVTVKSWSIEGIKFAVNNGYMNGVSFDIFDQTGTMTRAMIVSVLYRIAGSPEYTTENPFNDVSADNKWYYNAVLWAYENGIVTGTSETTFSPNDEVTREQIASLLYRFSKHLGYDTGNASDLSSFNDVSTVSSWAKDAFSWAVAEGHVTGAKDSGNVLLDPKGAATREQVATILMRFCEKYQGQDN